MRRTFVILDKMDRVIAQPSTCKKAKARAKVWSRRNQRFSRVVEVRSTRRHTVQGWREQVVPINRATYTGR